MSQLFPVQPAEQVQLLGKTQFPFTQPAGQIALLHVEPSQPLKQ